MVALSNGIGPLIGGALASQSRESWYIYISPHLSLSPLISQARNVAHFLQALDLPTEFAPDPHYHIVRDILYAASEGAWIVVTVSGRSDLMRLARRIC